MNKRDFLLASTLAAGALPTPLRAQQTPKGLASPAILTLSGAIHKVNRGGLDPALDQMMVKQAIRFDRAYVFDYAALTALPAAAIAPTLEYDNKVHTLKGPLLTEVVRAGAGADHDGQLLLRAVDGYSVVLSMADARKYRFIVATHLDGAPMPLGGLGPLWAVYDADRYPQRVALSLPERFAQCPWALYHIELQKA